MASIFLSYRRADTGPSCQQLAGDLIRRLGKEHVFFDLDSIAGGENFRQRLQQALRSADCIGVLIGPSWLTTTDASGRRRIDQPDDVVRYEVATALASGKPVIPVLVQQAPWPIPQGLPTSLERLSQCAPISLRDATQIEVVAAQLQRAALREELRRMPGVAYPALVVVILLTALAGIPFVLQLTFGLITMPPAVTELVSDIVRYTGLVALAIGVWHAVRARLWWWIPVWAALLVFAVAWPHALRYPLASGLGLALLVFGWSGPRLAAQIALRHVRVPMSTDA